MIRNQWYVVLESDDVKPGHPMGTTRMGEKMVFWRQQNGQVVCMGDVCPHLGAPLHLGKVKDNHLTCPFHGFEYDHSGQCVYLPAYGRNGQIPKAIHNKVYPTFEAFGMIWIYWGTPVGDIGRPKFFDSLDPSRFESISFRQTWNVHYSRMVENQLDVMHLPFVHYNTIGRGGKTVVDGPFVKIEDDLMEIWVYNRFDDGSPARKAEDLPEPVRSPFLQFRFPNLWQNWISEDTRITVAFVPVDEENSILYGRYYQRFVRVPVLRDLVNLAGKFASDYIAGQDRRVVTRQFPKKSDLRMGEKITQGDRAILTYRRRRQELLDQAAFISDEHSGTSNSR